MKSKLGGTSLFCLIVGFVPSFLLGRREDQYCFGPPVHNWAWQILRVSLLVMLLSGVGAFVGLFADHRKWLAGLAFFLWWPLILLVALASGCW